MKSEKLKAGNVRFTYKVETGWREEYTFCHEQRETAIAFAEMAVANRERTDAEIADGRYPKAIITIEEEV